jgi:hypothetical protein
MTNICLVTVLSSDENRSIRRQDWFYKYVEGSVLPRFNFNIVSPSSSNFSVLRSVCQCIVVGKTVAYLRSLFCYKAATCLPSVITGKRWLGKGCCVFKFAIYVSGWRKEKATRRAASVEADDPFGLLFSYV